MRRRRRTRSAQESISQINITNLVDVTIVTLIIFMLIAPIVEHGIDVRLPSSSPAKLTYQEPVTVSVATAGTLYLNNTRVTTEQLRERLTAMASAKPDLPVILRAGEDLPYKEIVSILDIARASGVVNLGLATKQGR